MQGFEPAADLLHVFPGIEGGDAEVSFTGGAETGSRRDDDMGLFEHLVEHAPGVDALGALHPDVGGIDAAVDGEIDFDAGFAEECGVAHVVIDEGLNLGLALVAEDGGGAPLDGV